MAATPERVNPASVRTEYGFCQMAAQMEFPKLTPPMIGSGDTNNRNKTSSPVTRPARRPHSFGPAPASCPEVGPRGIPWRRFLRGHL